MSAKNNCSILLFTFMFLFLLYGCITDKETKQIKQHISLEGEWLFAIDPHNKGIQEQWFSSKLKEIVRLPGTTDENKKGYKNVYTQESNRLSREYFYEGKAWYQKEIDIPSTYLGQNVFLILERTKFSKVWLDTTYIGESSTLLSPQRYDLSKAISSGKHLLSIMVDNGYDVLPKDITGSHALTEHTQTNWNGIIGQIYLDIHPGIYIQSIQIHPHIEGKKAIVKITICNNRSVDLNAEVALEARSWNSEKQENVKRQKFPIFITQGTSVYELEYQMGKHPLLWSEFSPNMYTMSTTLITPTGNDTQTTNFGMRYFTTDNTHFQINHTKTFLRGKQDACVFPLTGYPPTKVEEWQRLFRLAKSYGINHYRFHTWTPPEAAFEAADIEGIYIQTELPFWGWFRTSNQALNSFLYNEGIEILNNYGNHPSFAMFSLGNELLGEDRVMRQFIDKYKAKDNRHLYTFGSNNYLGTHGREEGEDFVVASRIGRDIDSSCNTHIRSSFSYADASEGGILNKYYPSTRWNYEEAIAYCPIPVIAHEVGQYQVYPSYKEIKKYTGILKPHNLSIFQHKLNEHHLPEMAEKFQKASGHFALACYKADIETALRTKGFGGYQLSDLQDYPGQGTALIGMLDAFMDSKGITTPEEFTMFSNRVVLLASFDKYCWYNDETFTADLYVANYAERELASKEILCQFINQNGEFVAQNKLNTTIPQGDVYKVGSIELPLNELKSPISVMLRVSMKDTKYFNQYSLWIYPRHANLQEKTHEHIVRKLDNKLFELLKQGHSVLLFPGQEIKNDNILQGSFTPDYWNYAMFKEISENTRRAASPGTLSLYMSSDHPFFKFFPTENHSNFQWWSIAKASTPFILDRTPRNYAPIVQVIDNIQRAHKLGILYEFKVGKGKLLVCMTDPEKLQHTPEGQQYYYALLKYLHSDKFKPSLQITEKDLLSLFMRSGPDTELIGIESITP